MYGRHNLSHGLNASHSDKAFDSQNQDLDGFNPVVNTIREKIVCCKLNDCRPNDLLTAIICHKLK
jgi:hypothetical protein